MYKEDILHARIQTMGVAEHTFDVNIHGKSVTWHLYDVGGARGQRHTWVVSDVFRLLLPAFVLILFIFEAIFRHS
jgi:hypothetical protein